MPARIVRVPRGPASRVSLRSLSDFSMRFGGEDFADAQIDGGELVDVDGGGEGFEGRSCGW